MTERAIEAAGKALREKLFNAIWRCGFAPDEDPAIIEAKKAEWPDDVRAAYRRADACLSVIAALAEDDAAVERIKAAIWETCRASDAIDNDLIGLSYAELISLPENSSVLFVKKLLADEARAAIRAMGGE